MRIFLMVGSGQVHRRIMSGLRGIRMVERQFGFDRGALSGRGFDRERATEAPDTLLHPENSHAALTLRIEAMAIIGNFDRDSVRALHDGYLRVFRSGVCGGVVQSFLDKAVNGDFRLVA